MKNLLITSLTLISLIMIDSCKQPIVLDQATIAASARVGQGKSIYAEDPSVKGDYEVHDGLLCFKSAGTYFALDSQMRNIDGAKKISFTNQLGFKSLLTIKQEVFNSLSEADNVTKFSQTLDTNKDIIKQEGDRINTLFSDVSEYLLNREGMVRIGGKVHCFAKDMTIIASTVADVREAYKSHKKPKDGIITFKNKLFASGARAASGTCQNINRSAYSQDVKRRVDVSVYIDYQEIYAYNDDYGNRRYTLRWTTYAQGRAYKKNFFGNWASYNTGNNLYAQYFVYLNVGDVRLAPYDPHNFTGNFNINSTTSNGSSTGIDYSQVLHDENNVAESILPSNNGITYSYYISENRDNSTYPTPIGKYTTDGVPDGVQIVCQ